MLGDLIDIHEVVVACDINEYGDRADLVDCHNGWGGGVGNGDDFVARAHAEGAEAQHQCVRAIINPDAVLNAVVACELLFER